MRRFPGWSHLSRYLLVVIALATALLLSFSPRILAHVPQIQASVPLSSTTPAPLLRIVPGLEEPLVATNQTTPQDDKALTKEAIDAESSGYFLVPRSSKPHPEWQKILAQSPEAKAVYGMRHPILISHTLPGIPPSPPPTLLGTKPCDPSIRGRGSCANSGPGGPNKPKNNPPCSRGMCVADVHIPLISLTLNDTPVS